eukprot:TRINITY_DN15039_c0_g1_i1.p2 TRINITY_DN15039_c0_g1~~TRINITY_DN15039_c0_g1_i1.p2  ORF type:complete len:482 (+),score=131.83 TRINITY_DN15039_c0_g1_i1:66-1511(+)
MALENAHLDINDLRVAKAGDPARLIESQRRRYKDASTVTSVIDLDQAWLKLEFETRAIVTEIKQISNQVKEASIKKDVALADELKAKSKALAVKKDEMTAQMEKALQERDAALDKCGNYVHDSVPVDNNEDNNRIERKWGEDLMEQRKRDGLLNHVDLMKRCDVMDLERGARIAGNRGYFLRGDLVLLNYALINYGLGFMVSKGFSPLQPPFFMKKDVMGACAQLEQFDEELYRVAMTSREGGKAAGGSADDVDDKYMIATSEQPIAAFHMGETIAVEALKTPICYIGISTNFRKEVGAHGRDTLGVFRTHQFEKLEQFVICAPEQSWDLHEKMIGYAEEFYQSLGIPYRVVNIVSGALNNAAAKKYDLEGWFPGATGGGTYRELVSCSNCTDYQSRKLGIRYGTGKTENQRIPYVHMLNSTLCATERLLCCIFENYQTADGIEVPAVLQPFMHGKTFIKFVKDLEVPKPAKGAKPAAAKQ